MSGPKLVMSLTLNPATPPVLEAANNREPSDRNGDAWCRGVERCGLTGFRHVGAEVGDVADVEPGYPTGARGSEQPRAVRSEWRRVVPRCRALRSDGLPACRGRSW